MSLPVNKAPSIRSVASNSSVASTTSGLSRRPRTRARSRTVTGDSAARAPHSNVDGLQVQEPTEFGRLVPDPPPLPPPRSPAKLNMEFTQGPLSPLSPTASDILPSPSYGNPPKLDHELLPSIAAMQRAAYKPPPSAFSRDPTFIPNSRDSLSTQQSGVSSLYPASLSTATPPDSPQSPRSMSDQMDNYLNRVPLSPENGDSHPFDGDDVTYRLELLVKNNYFLPPAHSKPSAADFATLDATTAKKPPKPPTTGFLDLFRAVKPRSKPVTPIGSPSPNAPPPMLRTTADSISTGHLLRPQAVPRSVSQTPRVSPHSTSRGRVVVVREKMTDIAAAAKQAEDDLRVRGVAFVQTTSQSVSNDVVDPTDAVDLPPPSASYPFAVQASALHGLGVQDSLGAALLADRLPPPKRSINDLSSTYDTDEVWRKALLHQAVHFSLDNTPDVSILSHGRTDAGSPPISGRMRSHSNVQTPQRGTPLRDFVTFTPPPLPSTPLGHERSRTKLSDIGLKSSSSKQALTGGNNLVRQSRSANFVPERAKTPVGPMTALSPAPRKIATSTQNSSQTDMSITLHGSGLPRTPSKTSQHAVRKARSSPLLSENGSYGSLHCPMTPPPNERPVFHDARIVSHSTFGTYDSPDNQSIASASFYSEDECESPGAPRRSLALSAIRGGRRTSLSEYSESSISSPTTSAFQDALNRGPYPYHGSASSLHDSRASLEHNSENSLINGARSLHSLSPPPRMSFSFTPQPPPPRSSNYPYQSEWQDSVASFDTERDPHEENDNFLRFDEPAPTSPPLVGLERPTDDIPPMSLDTPRRPSGATGISETSSFFDCIATQPNAMDDLETSDDSEEDLPPPPKRALSPQLSGFDGRTRAISTTSAPIIRPPIMKFENYSAPYVSRNGDASTSSRLPRSTATTPTSSKFTGISNVAPRPQFFSDRKHDNGHPVTGVGLNHFRDVQGHRSVSTASSMVHGDGLESSTMAQSGNGLAKTEPAPPSWRAQESLRKLDGMLLQHMETEKDTIRRIATTVKQNSALTSTPNLSAQP